MKQIIEKLVTFKERTDKLLDAAGEPEFMELSTTKVHLWDGFTIEPKYDISTITMENDNLVIEPKYHMDCSNILENSDSEFVLQGTPLKSGYDPERNDDTDFTYLFTHWTEGETISSAMATMTSKVYKKLNYGRLRKMLEQSNLMECVSHIGYEAFLKDDNAIIHLILSIHDQDTTADIRTWQIVDGESSTDWALARLTERTTMAKLLIYPHS